MAAHDVSRGMGSGAGRTGRPLHLEALERRLLLSGYAKKAYAAPDGSDDPQALGAIPEELLLNAESWSPEALAASLSGYTAGFEALSLGAEDVK